MAKSAKKPGRRGLGRGLGALISSEPVPIRKSEDSEQERGKGDAPVRTGSGGVVEQVRYVALEEVVPNADQPRKDFAIDEIDELANSIRQHGILQPIIVRPAPSEKSARYEIVAGERRWRAATKAQIEQIPVIIREFDDLGSLEVALIENLQRSDLNPIEEALAYQELRDRFSLSQAELADRVGKERATVSNCMRVLKLPDTVQSMLRRDELSLGHAKAILSVKEPKVQIGLAKKVVNEGLSVRQLEQIVSRDVDLKAAKSKTSPKGSSQAAAGDSEVTALTEKLQRLLGTKVRIRNREGGRGKIEIEYFSQAEYQRVIDRLIG